jgi:hypothetical protein
MTTFLEAHFNEAWNKLDKQRLQAREWLNEHGEECFAAGIHKLDLFQSIAGMEQCCERLKMKESLERIRQFKVRLHPLANLPFRVVDTEIFGIQKTVSREFESRIFAVILPKNVKYYECDDLFGKEVSASSPEIKDEIKAAGNCLAMELNAASAFHAIRAAEMGMRRLAEHFGVQVYREKGKIRMEIKDSSWNELITGIKNQIESEERKAKPERKVKGHFRDFKIMAEQLNRLKDDRNYAMHTQGDYKPSEAVAVFERVKDFMQKLATRISLK